jgi:hypothetical protein
VQEMLTTLVLLVGGGLLAWVLANLPAMEWLSGWAAVGTMALMFLMGYANVEIGEVVGRVIAPDCVGWDAYSRTVSRLGDRYELVVPRIHPAAITPADSRVVADEVREMSHDLRQLTPPAAAERVHENLRAVFSATETQLDLYMTGHGFDRTTLNALLDQQRSLAAMANRACR